MNLTPDVQNFRTRLQQFRPTSFVLPRILGMYSASIVLADDDLMSSAIRVGQEHQVTSVQFYEVVLQSYLFLGFPRMLIAAECMAGNMPLEHTAGSRLTIDNSEAQTWMARGIELCQRVYGKNYGSLKVRVEDFAPDVFRWMVLEGYGKVLSRPGLDIVNREISIMAFLIMENRPSQLYSHMRGALNVGASEELLRLAVTDIGEAAGEGFTCAMSFLEKLEVV